MTLKTYHATTMAEALAQVKRDMGRNAVILYTRSFRKGGLMGLIGGRSMWEVIASPNANVPSRLSRRPRTTGNGSQARDVPRQRELPTERSVLTATTGLSDEEFQDIGIEEIDEELSDVLGPVGEAPTLHVTEMASRRPSGPSAELEPDGESLVSPARPAYASKTGVAEAPAQDIKKMLESLLNHSSLHAARPQEPSPRATPAREAVVMPEAYREFHAHLLRQDVEEDIAIELMDQLRLSLVGMEQPDSKLIADRLCDLIASRIRVAAPATPPTARTGRPWVIALIGPTGVGKTTTLAKLAANYKLRQNCRVGLVTLDTYRIAAVDQLRTYAEIIEVPLRTVLSAGELHQAVHGMSNVDVVLIDTAGRSQNDQPRLNELRTMIAAAGADEVHLLVSATANRRCAKNILHRFAPLGANRIVLTKLDEAESYGTILSFSAEPEAPLSFVTTGQDVPDDIEPADPWQLAQRILKGR
jgi:flagellar biosynthesis protein FlhF